MIRVRETIPSDDLPPRDSPIVDDIPPGRVNRIDRAGEDPGDQIVPPFLLGPRSHQSRVEEDHRDRGRILDRVHTRFQPPGSEEEVIETLLESE